MGPGSREMVTTSTYLGTFLLVHENVLPPRRTCETPLTLLWALFATASPATGLVVAVVVAIVVFAAFVTMLLPVGITTALLPPVAAPSAVPGVVMSPSPLNVTGIVVGITCPSALMTTGVVEVAKFRHFSASGAPLLLYSLEAPTLALGADDRDELDGILGPNNAGALTTDDDGFPGNPFHVVNKRIPFQRFCFFKRRLHAPMNRRTDAYRAIHDWRRGSAGVAAEIYADGPARERAWWGKRSNQLRGSWRKVPRFERIITGSNH